MANLMHRRESPDSGKCFSLPVRSFQSVDRFHGPALSHWKAYTELPTQAPLASAP